MGTQGPSRETAPCAHAPTHLPYNCHPPPPLTTTNLPDDYANKAPFTDTFFQQTNADGHEKANEEK